MKFASLVPVIHQQPLPQFSLQFIAPGIFQLTSPNKNSNKLRPIGSENSISNSISSNNDDPNAEMGNPDTNHKLSSTSAGKTFIDNGKVEGETKDQRIPVEGMISPNKAERIAYMADRADFRAARMRCARACEEYNNMDEDSSTEERMSKWLK